MTAYVVCVIVMTALGTGLMMLFRPAFDHSVRKLLGLEAHPKTTANSFFTMRVAPVLEEHCVSCHGENRQKAKLRLDSYAATLWGGKDGPVIKAGNLHDSELFARITLPASNDRVMPPSSKPRMPADDVTVIRLWIAAGASGMQPVAQIKGAPPPVAKVKFVEIDEAAVEKARAGQSVLVRQLQQRYPGSINYESRVSANLEVNASLVGASFHDADLKQLAPLSDHVVWADFSGTAVTDASIQVILKMRNLRALRLNNLLLKSSTIFALSSLKGLHSLTIVGTPVAAESVLALRTKGVTVYDGNDG
jgi:hypothetical protein